VIGFLKRAIAFYGQHNLTVEQLFTDKSLLKRHSVWRGTDLLRERRNRTERPPEGAAAQEGLRPTRRQKVLIVTVSTRYR
jgi:hypothetical protein